MSTKIEWADEVWNPVTGCSPVSEGCRNCYARRMAQRLKGRFGYPADDPFKVTFHPDRINQPLKWKKPRRVFVCSMGDLFHPEVDEAWILNVWQAMGEFYDAEGNIQPANDRPGHTYLVLTKRPERALDFLGTRYPEGHERKNVWVGVTAENQEEADRRIPVLLQIPAARRFVSLEPLLGPVNLESYLGGYKEEWDACNAHTIDAPVLDWVIAGCESGPKRRRTDWEWFRFIREQCKAYGHRVPFFLKQMDVDGKLVKMPALDGKVWDEVPE